MNAKIEKEGKEKEGEDSGAQAIADGLAANEGGDFEDAFYPMRDLGGTVKIKKTSQVCTNDNDDDFYPIN